MKFTPITNNTIDEKKYIIEIIDAIEEMSTKSKITISQKVDKKQLNLLNAKQMIILQDAINTLESGFSGNCCEENCCQTQSCQSMSKSC